MRILAAVLLALLAPAAASARGPSTADERKRAVDITHRLEKEPLARSLAERREWLLRFIVEAPDFNVKSCKGPLDALAQDEEDPYAKLLYVQSIFGMAAFMFEHPKEAKDWAAVQVAGIESTLKAYDSLRRADSEARWKELDRLAGVQKSGKLKALVEKEMAGCPKEEEEAGPSPRDAI